MKNERAIYLLALALPFLLPLAMFPFTNLPLPHPTPDGWVLLDKNTPRGGVTEYCLMLMMAVRMAGIPYLAFCLFVFRWGWNRAAKTLLIASWFLPLVFIPFIFCWAALIGAYDRNFSSGTLLNNSSLDFAFSLLAIPFGYFYVVIGNILVFVASIFSRGLRLEAVACQHHHPPERPDRHSCR